MTTKPGSGKKRETRWTGYKLHISETCDEDRPHLITPVATTSAPITDEVMTDPIQQDLETSPTGPWPTLARFGIYYRSHPCLQKASGD
jgi:transposase